MRTRECTRASACKRVRVPPAGDDEVGASPNGVAWQLGPLKKANRIVEKLCLDPAQRAALDSCKPAALDASGVLDTVRGMLTCNTMAHAFQLLRTLTRRFGENGENRTDARLVRSKNRFARPSGGGWMDCLVNVAVYLAEGDCWFVCEVQIVHSQLLLVRAELGAHHAYNDYRAALEMLEWAGCAELGAGDVDASKRWLTRAVFSALRGPDGSSLLSDREAADERALDALAAKQTWCLSRAGGGRPWPRLVDLNLDGRSLATVEEASEHAAAVRDTLCGLRGLKSAGGRAGTLATAVVEAASESAKGSLTLWSYLLEGHTGRVNSACVSPDGKHVVTASEDETARAWLFVE